MITQCAFERFKYGRELTIDARPVSGWLGVVPAIGAHTLDFQEVLIVRSGRGTIQFDDDVVELQSDVAVVTPPYQTRVVTVVEPLDAELVVFTPDATDRLLPASSARLAGPGASAIVDVAALMAAEISAGSDDLPEMLNALLAQLSILLRRVGRPLHARAHAGSPLVARLESLVEAHFREEHRPRSYADRLHVTLDHLSSVVRRAGRGSVSGLIQHRVQRESQRLLRYTDAGVAEIAFVLGFEDASHFARVFKRSAGVSPSEFRRKISERSS